MLVKRLRPPVKTHGGKSALAPWLISHFPFGYQHMAYIEPFCGSASVLLNKERSLFEQISDIDFATIAILEEIQENVDEFVWELSRLTYTQETFDAALDKEQLGYFDSRRSIALNEYVLRRMSRGGMRKTFAWSERQRGGRPGDLNAWMTALELLPAISERLRGVSIYNMSAFEYIESINDTEKTTLNRSNCFMYVDCPYLPDTRTAKKVYEYELSMEDHVRLATLLLDFKGSVMISGYDHALYDTLYKGWTKHTKDMPNHSGQGQTKERRIESIWCNY